MRYIHFIHVVMQTFIGVFTYFNDTSNWLNESCTYVLIN